MRKFLLHIGLLFIFILSGCSPKISTHMTKSYSPLPNEAEVKVYFSQALLPNQREVLGDVQVRDNGMSTNCDSLTVINKIKEESRKVGGNAVLILRHDKPSVWSSSCHQMEAVILKVFDFEDVTSVGDVKVQLPKEKKERILPRFGVDLSGGYAWRTAKIKEGITGEEREFLKKMKNGPSWSGSANYYFSDNIGLGLTYSGFSSGNSTWATETESGQYGILRLRDNITYVGPAFLVRMTSNKKLFFNINIGLGYVSYSSITDFNNNRVKLRGASVGVLYELRGEYLLTKHWGVGAGFSALGSALNSYRIKENGTERTVKLSEDEKEGLGYIRLGMNIKYYF